MCIIILPWPHLPSFPCSRPICSPLFSCYSFLRCPSLHLGHPSTLSGPRIQESFILPESSSPQPPALAALQSRLCLLCPALPRAIHDALSLSSMSHLLCRPVTSPLGHHSLSCDPRSLHSFPSLVASCLCLSSDLLKV